MPCDRPLLLCRSLRAAVGPSSDARSRLEEAERLGGRLPIQPAHVCRLRSCPGQSPREEKARIARYRARAILPGGPRRTWGLRAPQPLRNVLPHEQAAPAKETGRYIRANARLVGAASRKRRRPGAATPHRCEGLPEDTDVRPRARAR